MAVATSLLKVVSYLMHASVWCPRAQSVVLFAPLGEGSSSDGDDGQLDALKTKASLKVMNVDYIAAARRHIRDAHLLQYHGHQANAGQLFGICVECGLKSLLVRGGATVTADGDLLRPFREHLPKLDVLVNGLAVLPDGRAASILQSRLPNLASLAQWSIEHRYWREPAIPLSTHLKQWELAALEMHALLDEVAGGGVL